MDFDHRCTAKEVNIILRSTYRHICCQIVVTDYLSTLTFMHQSLVFFWFRVSNPLSYYSFVVQLCTMLSKLRIVD